MLSEQLLRPPPDGPLEMLEAEENRRQAGLRVTDLLIARDILRIHLDQERVKRDIIIAKKKFKEENEDERLIHKGWREVSVRLQGGMVFRFWTPYIRLSRRGKVGRPRGSGKRRKGGTGLYPVLENISIRNRATPATREAIARQVISSDSYAEAKQQLEWAGMTIPISAITTIAVGMGSLAIDIHQRALKEARDKPLTEASMVEGLRLQISIDGGRAKTRTTKKTSPKGKNGRRPFDLSWREPRIVTVSVLDEDGKQDRNFRPLYEASLCDADGVFSDLTGLLRLLGAHRVASLVFISDGASWIWSRLYQLLVDAKIPECKVSFVLDFYHATEHIHQALSACRTLESVERVKEFSRLRRLLLNEPDGAEQVIAELWKLARGRRAKAIKAEIAYLSEHISNMQYAHLRSERLPIGSGVVESTVRRVINLRFKSASMAWSVEHLKPLLALRALMKSGRWTDFISAALEGKHWLEGSFDEGRRKRQERQKAA